MPDDGMLPLDGYEVRVLPDGDRIAEMRSGQVVVTWRVSAERAGGLAAALWGEDGAAP